MTLSDKKHPYVTLSTENHSLTAESVISSSPGGLMRSPYANVNFCRSLLTDCSSCRKGFPPCPSLPVASPMHPLEKGAFPAPEEYQPFSTKMGTWYGCKHTEMTLILHWLGVPTPSPPPHPSLYIFCWLAQFTAATQTSTSLLIISSQVYQFFAQRSIKAFSPVILQLVLSYCMRVSLHIWKLKCDFFILSSIYLMLTWFLDPAKDHN